ncbi:Zf-FLZ domain [Arabidopsis thaliana x Arabidopsis arenosa]|uniref:Zf-FLZ domain n=1 Tax=Arabidopsis thaliana x Arabidopsis arenosa TaxID=1240361 RepID=A0A8T2BL12_9BRAS|nr:Zf-FLZ domain [Arabidopsis thaliana x Arabidopsis arenosa]
MILSKRPHLMIRKLSEMLVPRSRSAAIKPEEYTASPRSPLDLNFPSPVNSKRFGSGGVGLGIVAALEETSNGINRHDPVRYSGRFKCPEIDLSDEEYTYVTSPNGLTKVYYNDDGFELCENDYRKVHKPMVIVDEPPVIKRQSYRDPTEFLSSCCLCKKKLQGKDVYMYKGEMGFCSAECRSVQIMNDERKEQCKTQVSRNVDVSSSPYAAGQRLSAGIFVF